MKVGDQIAFCNGCNFAGEIKAGEPIKSTVVGEYAPSGAAVVYAVDRGMRVSRGITVLENPDDKVFRPAIKSHIANCKNRGGCLLELAGYNAVPVPEGDERQGLINLYEETGH